MTQRTRKEEPLSEQVRKRVSTKIEPIEKYPDGNFGTIISSGSTLLDLALSGGRVRGGGLPGGILVEIFGPSGSGKTVFLSEIAGGVQRQGGDLIFHDPEARLNPQFAKLFGLELAEGTYFNPDTVPEVFEPVRTWKPTFQDGTVINGIFADSLAALSTDMEMEKKDGDKMGGRRAKEFSEGTRKTCRIIKDKNYLMVCSNQIRQNMDAMAFSKYTTPGGEAIGFYASVRLKTQIIKKHKVEKTFKGKDISKIVGVRVEVEVFKSSIWEPFHNAPVTILFDYGIDDIRENLQFIKDYSKYNVYTLNGETLHKELAQAIRIIEEDHAEQELKEEVINLWEEREKTFKIERKPKR
jgi:recombination protein RecA